MDQSSSSTSSSSSSHGRRCSRRTRRRHRHCRVSSSMRRNASSSSSSLVAVAVLLSVVMVIAAVTFDSSAATAASASAFTDAAAAIAATEVEDPTLPEAAAASSEAEEEEGSCTNNDSSSNNNTEGAGSCDSDSPVEETEDADDGSKDIPPEVVMYKDRWVGCEDYERVWDEYEQVEEYQTLQQSVDVYYSEQSDDGCLFLHGYLHMCSSNRPHYHEPFVHYPGRFLSNVERVLFIGGGDSMVLHEVMKYPTVELVVGLELDQSVVRSSFQFFGTQPHWDDDRVEWYFGDGAKSLNLLPRDYYGTFDLVVVDILSPIAQSLQVNDELTVMEALMLLLKPDGIIVKNEDEGYIPGANTANFTKHSVEIMFHDVPIYCLQTFVVGTNSNNKNFKDAVPKDHGVETKYLKNVDEFQSQFDSYYTSNDKNLLDVMCERPLTSSSSTTTNLPADDEKKSNNGEEDEDLELLQKERREKQAEEKEDAESTTSEEEKKSATNTTDADDEDEASEREDWDYMKLVKWQAPIGVNMILEAESTSGGDSKFRTTSDIVSTFRPILTSDELGLVIVDTNELEFTRDDFTANVVTFIVDQGYIVVRCVPALSYCGFDIQLWADFHKHPQIKSALLSGVGGATNISQFRVVTSGMIDAKNEQSELIGPPSVRDYCDSRSTTETTSSEQGVTSVTVELAQTPLNEREFRNMTLHSYDSTSRSAREQWSSQRSIGVQTISQFEETKGKNVRLPSVVTILKKAIELNNANEQDDDDDDDDESIETQEVNDFSGNGSIVIASWSKGQAIVLWDGDGRVDVNWFVFGVDTDIPDSLMATFDNAISMLLAFTAIVRDEIPRGTGRIIDFHSEFENRDDVDPLWF
mmetsp:Transcript_38988/g.94363  ORF Transcript_38988/g.94363 Transcript_38988/m.94363 type:complete len:865 (-) Transcript_38988:169-2763(-)